MRPRTRRGQIWRSPTGNPGTWQVVKDDLDPGVGSSSSPTAYKDYLISRGLHTATVFLSGDLGMAAIGKRLP